MDAYYTYIPVLVAAIVVFALLTWNPTWLQGSKYGDKPKSRPDALVTSIIVFAVGAVVAWLLESKVITLGGACYSY